MSGTPDAFASEVQVGSRVLQGSRLWWLAPLAGGIAGCMNVLVYAYAQMSGEELLVPAEGTALEPLSAVTPLITTVGLGLLAGVILALLNRFTRHPARNFTLVAAVVLLLTLVPIIQMPAAVTAATRVFLAVMHVLAGITITSILVLGAHKPNVEVHHEIHT